MNKAISIGSRVITRKFESNEDCGFDPRMSQFINKEDEVTAIGHNGNCCVHGYYWPPSAVELVKEKDQFYDDEAAFLNPPSPAFQPEYGKEYEFSDDQKYWYKLIFAANNPILSDLNKYISVNETGYCQVWKHIRPIRRTLEEKLREWFDDRRTPIGDNQEDAVYSLMRLLNNHQSEFTDEEIIEYIDKHYPLLNKNAAIATVRHFTTLKWKG